MSKALRCRKATKRIKPSRCSFWQQQGRQQPLQVVSVLDNHRHEDYQTRQMDLGKMDEIVRCVKSGLQVKDSLWKDGDS